MKTEQWIRLLATGAGPAPRRHVQTRIGAALVGGVLASSAFSLAALGLNPTLSGMGWALVGKLAYVVAVLGGATWWMARCARPGAAWHRPAATVAAALLLLATWAAVAFSLAPPSGRWTTVLGESWSSCPWRVAALSVPAFALAFRALRALAPTRPRQAGFAAGLFAGAAGALGYALFCSELSPVFVLVWYSLGMLLPAALGAALGPRWLRW